MANTLRMLQAILAMGALLGGCESTEPVEDEDAGRGAARSAVAASDAGACSGLAVTGTPWVGDYAGPQAACPSPCWAVMASQVDRGAACHRPILVYCGGPDFGMTADSVAVEGPGGQLVRTSGSIAGLLGWSSFYGDAPAEGRACAD